MDKVAEILLEWEAVNAPPANELQPAWYTASRDVPTIKRELSDWLYSEVHGVVQTGPFMNMKLLGEVARKDTYLTPFLLGSYEEELHGELERQIRRLEKLPNPKISVIGCSEGYYAVGLKLRLPNSVVHAVDTDAVALDICHRNAVANGVSFVGSPDSSDYLTNMDLIVMDCEGAETYYLDPDKYPSLYGTHMIVEVHDFAQGSSKGYTISVGDAKKFLLQRFRGSHHITCIFEGPRNPNKYQWLILTPSEYRWMAVCEGRPYTMYWFVLEPKGVSLS